MKIPNFKLLLAFLVCLSYTGYGQPFPPQPRAIPPPVGAPVPIDDDLWILFVCGVLLGLFFLFKKLRYTP